MISVAEIGRLISRALGSATTSVDSGDGEQSPLFVSTFAKRDKQLVLLKLD